MHLPFADEVFDVVVCRSVMFFPAPAHLLSAACAPCGWSFIFNVWIASTHEFADPFPSLAPCFRMIFPIHARVPMDSSARMLDAGASASPMVTFPHGVRNRRAPAVLLVSRCSLARVRSLSPDCVMPSPDSAQVRLRKSPTSWSLAPAFVLPVRARVPGRHVRRPAPTGRGDVLCLVRVCGASIGGRHRPAEVLGRHCQHRTAIPRARPGIAAWAPDARSLRFRPRWTRTSTGARRLPASHLPRLAGTPTWWTSCIASPRKR